MNSQGKRGTAALVAATAMALSLAGCNGSSKPSATAATTNATDAATTTSQPTTAATSQQPAAATTPAAAASSTSQPSGSSPSATQGGLPVNPSLPALPTTGAATTPAAPPPATSAAVTSAPAPTGGASCAALTSAAATAALGKATTVKLDSTVKGLPGLSICNVTITGEVYPVQLAVDTTSGAQQFAADKSVNSSVKNISGVGDQAFSDEISVEALAKGADIKVTGPAGPVLENDFSVPTALAKAMVAALH